MRRLSTLLVSTLFAAALPGCSSPDENTTPEVPVETSGLCAQAFAPDATVAPEALQARLETAVAGEVILVTPGSITGSLVVPAGVVLLGDGVTVQAAGGAGLRLRGGSAAAPTVVRGFTVTASDSEVPVAAITAIGGGPLVLSNLTVQASTGAGVVSEGVSDLQICESTITGGLDDASFEALRDLPVVRATDAAILGLVVTAGDLTEAARVSIRDLTIRNIAGFGAAFVDTAASWERGRVEGCAGTGIFLSRSTHGWSDVVVADGRASATGSATFQTGWGVVNATGSRLDTDGLQIAAIPGFGLFQSGARSQHLGARIVSNQLRGVVVQESLATSPDDPELLFDQAVLVGNGGAGVQVVDGGGIVFQNGIVAESRSLPNLSGGLGSAAGAMCDGIQLNSSTESSVGTQLRADRSVIFGNGQAGINAQGAGTSLLADGSSAIAVCGTTELDSDRWSCSETEEGELDCLRLEGPAVTGGWSCTDSGGATVCRSGDPLAVDAIAPSFPVRNAADGVPSFCREDAESIVGENGLVVSSGLVEAGAAPGFDKAESGGDGTGYGWSCTTVGTERVCTSEELDRIAVDDLDNPSLTQGSGWSCSYTAEGRRCRWAGFGVAATSEVSGATLFTPKVEPRIVNRDQLVRAGLVVAPGVELRRDPTLVPRLSGGARSIVGENGLVNPDGTFGSRAIVGENGVVGEDG